MNENMTYRSILSVGTDAVIISVCTSPKPASRSACETYDGSFQGTLLFKRAMISDSVGLYGGLDMRAMQRASKDALKNVHVSTMIPRASVKVGS